MRFEINNTASIAKNFSVKQRKQGGVVQTVAVLKFDGLFIDRESSDEMLGLPIGAIGQLYGEDGLPVSVITIGRKHVVFQFAGAIKGNANRQEARALGKDTEVIKAELQLAPNGAMLSGAFCWPVKGDEVEDLEPLMGETCVIDGVLVLPEQIDAFSQARDAADQAIAKLKGAR